MRTLAEIGPLVISDYLKTPQECGAYLQSMLGGVFTAQELMAAVGHVEKAMQAHAQKAVEAEREACARLCESEAGRMMELQIKAGYDYEALYDSAMQCGFAIRARKEST